MPWRSPEALGADDAHTARIEINLSDLLSKCGNLQESERLLRESLRAQRQLLPANHPGIFGSERRLGECSRRQAALRKRNRS